MEKVSEKINHLLSVDLWEWTRDGSSDEWAKISCNILEEYSSENIIESLKDFLALKSETDVLSILEHFIQKIQWVFRRSRRSERINLSGDLLELHSRMMREKRPAHQSYYFIIRQKLGLDRKLLYNKIIECFLEYNSSKVNFYIWNKQIHRCFERDNSINRNHTRK